MAKKDRPKKEKEKIVYIDDGSSLADMSGVSRDIGFGTLPAGKSGGRDAKKAPPRRRNPYAAGPESCTPWQTYIRSVRMMIVPMLAVLGILCVAFLLMYLFLR